MSSTNEAPASSTDEVPASSTSATPASSNRSRAIWVIAGVLLLAGSVALAWWRLSTPSGPVRPPEGPVPVQVTAATLRDLPIHLEGVGTVTPLQTAIVRPRVDGVLERVVFTEGQPVHAGDVLAEIDARPFRVALQQTQAVLARDQAMLTQAQATLERDRRLHDNALLSTQDLETQTANVAQLDGTVRADRAQIEAARLQLDYTRVQAPIDGLTGLRQIDPGNSVHTTDPNGLVVITQIDPIAVLFSLPQDDLGTISAQMAHGSLEVEVLSRDGTSTLATGNLMLVDNRVDPLTATIRLKAQIPNEERRLWPNLLVEIRLLVETRIGALVVPDVAVQQGPDQTFVYVVANGHATVRPVRIERVEGDVAVVSQGLAAGEQVVIEGQSRLRDGAAVNLGGEHGGGARGGAPGGHAPGGHGTGGSAHGGHRGPQ